MANKYKVMNMIGENDETGEKYYFSFPGAHWDCQSAWGAQVKAGNNEAKIMVLTERELEDGSKKPEWIADEAGMEYARKRFNIGTKVYNVVLHARLVEESKALSDFAKLVKAGKYTGPEHEKLINSINAFYDFVLEHNPVKE